jgi:hypothetical protein
MDFENRIQRALFNFGDLDFKKIYANGKLCIVKNYDGDVWLIIINDIPFLFQYTYRKISGVPQLDWYDEIEPNDLEWDLLRDNMTDDQLSILSDYFVDYY